MSDRCYNFDIVSVTLTPGPIFRSVMECKFKMALMDTTSGGYFVAGKNHHLLNSGLLVWLRSTQRSYKAKNCSKYIYKFVEEFPEILYSSEKGTKWHIFSLLVEKYVKVFLIAEKWH